MLKKWCVFFMFGLLLLVSLLGCSIQEPSSASEQWQQIMADAVFTEDDEVEKLVTLTQEDPLVIWDENGTRVLLLTWHANPSPGESGEGLTWDEVWATSLAEMLAWYQQEGDAVTDWDLRFAQLLGLHADEGYTHFTAFWVSPSAVIRPAYVTAVDAQMVNDDRQVRDSEYAEWFDDNIIYSYFISDYPWTRLGYTYDWGSEDSEYGLTEFLLLEGLAAEVAFTYTTEEFVAWLAEQPSIL